MCFWMSFSDDYNRVVLTQLPNEPYSDYINASYMNVNFQRNF